MVKRKISKDRVSEVVISLRFKKRRDDTKTGSEVSTWECQRQDGKR